MAETKTLARKLLDVMDEIEKLKKDGHNAFHNYDYVSETAVVEAVRQLLVNHGVFAHPTLLWACQEQRTVKTKDGDKTNTHSFVTMKYTLINADDRDDFYESQWIGEGQDSGDKGYYKAYTGAQKYFIMKTFMIPTGDDSENDGKKPSREAPTTTNTIPYTPPKAVTETLKAEASDKQIGLIHVLVDKLNFGKEEFQPYRDRYGITSTKELTKKQASDMIKELQGILELKDEAGRELEGAIDESPF